MCEGMASIERVFAGGRCWWNLTLDVLVFGGWVLVRREDVVGDRFTCDFCMPWLRIFVTQASISSSDTNTESLFTQHRSYRRAL